MAAVAEREICSSCSRAAKRPTECRSVLTGTRPCHHGQSDASQPAGRTTKSRLQGQAAELSEAIEGLLTTRQWSAAHRAVLDASWAPGVSTRDCQRWLALVDVEPQCDADEATPKKRRRNKSKKHCDRDGTTPRVTPSSSSSSSVSMAITTLPGRLESYSFDELRLLQDSRWQLRRLLERTVVQRFATLSKPLLERFPALAIDFAPGAQRGLFATRDLDTGEVVLEERPLLTASELDGGCGACCRPLTSLPLSKAADAAAAAAAATPDVVIVAPEDALSKQRDPSLGDSVRFDCAARLCDFGGNQMSHALSAQDKQIPTAVHGGHNTVACDGQGHCGCEVYCSTVCRDWAWSKWHRTLCRLPLPRQTLVDQESAFVLRALALARQCPADAALLGELADAWLPLGADTVQRVRELSASLGWAGSAFGLDVSRADEWHRVLSCNAYAIEAKPRDWGGLVLGLGSLLNHSCVPNATWHFVWPAEGGLVVRFQTLRPIVAGEQLTVSYFPHLDLDNVRDRQRTLRKWMAVCSCPLCCEQRLAAV